MDSTRNYRNAMLPWVLPPAALRERAERQETPRKPMSEVTGGQEQEGRLLDQASLDAIPRFDKMDCLIQSSFRRPSMLSQPRQPSSPCRAHRPVNPSLVRSLRSAGAETLDSKSKILIRVSRFAWRLGGSSSDFRRPRIHLQSCRVSDMIMPVECNRERFERMDMNRFSFRSGVKCSSLLGGMRKASPGRSRPEIPGDA